MGHIRIHCDRVEGLGDFLELEVGLTDEQVKHVYGMYDSDLDKLMFTNYHKYATIMEKKHLRGGVLK